MDQVYGSQAKALNQLSHLFFCGRAVTSEK
jgi:hypothetical protein